jgi:hypothetical protein
MDQSAESKVVGTVELPLQSYLDLREAGHKAIDQRRRLSKISEQLEIFLSFMSREDHFREAMKQFNNQSNICEIHIVDNRVKIRMLDEEESYTG